jgi:hypothetical protein
MKTRLNRSLMLAAVTVLAAGSAWGQVKATVPFNFQVNGIQLGAGTYSISRLGTANSPVLDLHKRGSGSVLSQPTSLPAQPNDLRPRLVFRCAAGACSLAEMWDGENGYRWAPSKIRGKEIGDERIAVIYLDKNGLDKPAAE